MQHHLHLPKTDPPTSTRDNSTTMTPIEKALAAVDAQDPKERLSYRAAAKKFSVVLSTLTRRHHKQTQSCAAAAENTKLLTTQHEAELVKYIQKLSSCGLGLTRSIIKNFVLNIAE